MIKRYIINILNRLRKRYPYDIKKGDIIQVGDNRWKVKLIKYGNCTREVDYELVLFDNKPF